MMQQIEDISHSYYRPADGVSWGDILRLLADHCGSPMVDAKDYQCVALPSSNVWVVEAGRYGEPISRVDGCARVIDAGRQQRLSKLAPADAQLVDDPLAHSPIRWSVVQLRYPRHAIVHLVTGRWLKWQAVLSVSETPSEGVSELLGVLSKLVVTEAAPVALAAAACGETSPMPCTDDVRVVATAPGALDADLFGLVQTLMKKRALAVDAESGDTDAENDLIDEIVTLFPVGLHKSMVPDDMPPTIDEGCC